MSSGGVLEVLLVNAKGIKQARLLGSSSNVIIECGAHSISSKFTDDEGGKAWWNEKFSFNLTSVDMNDVTNIRLRIMGRDKLSQSYHIGEATIHTAEMLKAAANSRGIRSIEMKAAPYNILLKDKTYRGEIKVGLKFIYNATVRTLNLFNSY